MCAGSPDVRPWIQGAQHRHWMVQRMQVAVGRDNPWPSCFYPNWKQCRGKCMATRWLSLSCVITTQMKVSASS